jgi:hypothetical protein
VLLQTQVWQFAGSEFYEQESFRAHLHAAHLPQELLHLLPKDDPKGPERPAEAALRSRMTELLQQVRAWVCRSRQQLGEPRWGGGLAAVAGALSQV